ncbi:3-hydroxyacyl-ACP dehydratase FabZ family protein [Nocardia sp. NPDC059177]|uniref:3-hydroxyacyl-ACP dehydratase FabZ family protein n=1 Tax=Nocardia sp. NPDC059177 TaxID=3346759 RepID=UPI0036924AF5
MLVSGRVAPLSAVDKVDRIEELHAVGFKTVRATDPYMDGHYPGFPIYPAVFMVESVLQTVQHLFADRGVSIREVRSLRVRAPIIENDELRIDCRGDAAGGELVVKASCTRGDGAEAGRVVLLCDVR